MKLSKIQTPLLCHCESGKPYSACCKTYHSGIAAPIAEALMRSRYSAYVFGLEDYLLQTLHPESRPIALNLAEDIATIWLGLQIMHAESNSVVKETVEFVARYKIGGKAERLHELSEFVRIDTRWYYLTGNDPSNI